MSNMFVGFNTSYILFLGEILLLVYYKDDILNLSTPPLHVPLSMSKRVPDSLHTSHT